MTGAKITVIPICFHENDGIVHAYSPELPGLHVCGKRRESVIADLPEVIQKLYKLNDKLEVKVTIASTPQFRRPAPRKGPVHFVAASQEQSVAA